MLLLRMTPSFMGALCPLPWVERGLRLVGSELRLLRLLIVGIAPVFTRPPCTVGMTALVGLLRVSALDVLVFLGLLVARVSPLLVFGSVGLSRALLLLSLPAPS